MNDGLVYYWFPEKKKRMKEVFIVQKYGQGGRKV